MDHLPQTSLVTCYAGVTSTKENLSKKKTSRRGCIANWVHPVTHPRLDRSLLEKEEEEAHISNSRLATILPSYSKKNPRKSQPGFCFCLDLAVILLFPVSSLRNHGDWIQLYSFLSATPTVIFSFFFFPSLAMGSLSS
jgi:hypothetical protein